MSKLKGLLLTEGMHGMISQVEGLAKALDIDFIHQKVEINTLAKLLPPKITPISNLFFKRFSVPEIINSDPEISELILSMINPPETEGGEGALLIKLKKL